MSVSEILSRKGSNTITTNGNASIGEVANLLSSRKIGAIVVLDDDKVCGIISERDVVRQVAEQGAEALDAPISTCMTQRVVSCEPGDSINSLMEKMTTGKFRHLPVIDNGSLVGIVSIGDVVKMKIEQAEHEAEEMKRCIAG